MTKAKLRRLIELSAICVSAEASEELDRLRAEFEAWEPEQAIPRCPNCDYLSWACRRCGHVEIAGESG